MRSPSDQLDELRRGQAALKVQLGGEDRWNPQAHGLAEDVAQRQRVQNAQRMNQPLVAHVRLGAVFDGAHAGQHVAVRKHDALGVAGGAGGEENLQRRLVRQGRRSRPSPRPGSSPSQSSKASVGICGDVAGRGQLGEQHRVADGELRA